MNPDTIARIAEKWDSLPPDQRRFQFRLGNIPLVYAKWDELDAIDQRCVLNAARIIGSFSLVKYQQMFGGK